LRVETGRTDDGDCPPEPWRRLHPPAGAPEPDRTREAAIPYAHARNGDRCEGAAGDDGRDTGWTWPVTDGPADPPQHLPLRDDPTAGHRGAQVPARYRPPT